MAANTERVLNSPATALPSLAIRRHLICRCIAARKSGPFDLEVFETRAVAKRVIEFAKQPTDIVQIDRASGFNWGHRFGHDSSMVPAM